MDWYWIVLIVIGGVGLLYTALCLLIAKQLLKTATTPVAHTFDDVRLAQQENEHVDYTNYDKNWRKQVFELDGILGKIRGEIIFNDATSPFNRAKVAVICHGHTMNRLNSMKYAQIFYDKGYNVIIYDHAYFGESDGDHTTLGYNERHDLSKVIDLARSTFGADAIVGLHGESMGAATVLCELELRDDIQFVVADCGFSDTMKYYRQLCFHLIHLPGFPIVDFANIMSKAKYGYNFYKVMPINGVKKSSTPICFIHGLDDKFIYPSHSVAMYQASHNKLNELHLFEDATHATSHKQDKERYIRTVNNFVDKVETEILSTATDAK